MKIIGQVARKDSSVVNSTNLEILRWQCCLNQNDNQSWKCSLLSIIESRITQIFWISGALHIFDYHKVPNIVVNNQVPWDGWNHLDFLYAIDIDQYQNDDLLAALAMYPID